MKPRRNQSRQCILDAHGSRPSQTGAHSMTLVPLGAGRNHSRVCRDDVSELEPGEWAEFVRLAETDADFRSACLTLEHTQEVGLLHLMQSICRSINARIACEYALA